MVGIFSKVRFNFSSPPRYVIIYLYIYYRLGGDPTGTYGHTTYSSSNGGLAGGGHVDAPTSSPGIPANATLVSRTKQQLTTQQVCLIRSCFTTSCCCYWTGVISCAGFRPTITFLSFSFPFYLFKPRG